MLHNVYLCHDDSQHQGKLPDLGNKKTPVSLPYWCALSSSLRED
jgi:hypothetical protein